MGQLDRSSTVWQWHIRRPAAVDWRAFGRSMTEAEARRWAVANGYEIRRVDGTESTGPARDAAEPVVAPVNVRSTLAER